MFICGTASFENDTHSISPSSTPKRSKSFCKIGKDSGSKNPYASRGLDKFYALLADLDDKKQKIYTQLGSDVDVSFVRFVYSNESDQVKPIVVKSSKEKNRRSPGRSGTDHDHPNGTENPKVLSDEKIDDQGSKEKEEKKKSLVRYDGSSFKVEKLRQPYYYVPASIVLILLFLVVYGRTFAILCTSIGWYLIPTVCNNGGGTSTSRQSQSRPSSTGKTAARKKEFTRKVTMSSNKEEGSSSSPRSVINGLVHINGSDKEKQIGHRRSF